MNIIEHIAKWAIDTPEAKALVYDRNKHVTYAELLRMIHGAAGILNKHPTGSHVGFLMKDNVYQVAMRLASMQVGVIAVPLTARVPKAEFDKRAALFSFETIYADAEYAEHLNGYHVTRIDDFESSVIQHSSSEYRSNNNDRMSMAWSGGTTGTPSGFYYSHNSMESLAVQHNNQWSGVTGSMVYYPVVPQFGGAFVMYLIIALTHGHAIVVESRAFTPNVVAENIINHGVTHIMATAPVFHTMLRKQVLPKQNVPRQCMASADAVSTKVQKEWQEYYDSKLTVLFAASQMGGFSEQLEHHPLESVGSQWPGYDVRLLDDEGNEVPDDCAGQLWIKGAGCAVGDITVDGSTNLNSDGFITTGDMLIRKNGIYFWAGRQKDTFKVNGQFVSVLKIEDHVRTIDGVYDAVAVPAFDSDGLSRVKVYVVAEQDYSNKEKIAQDITSLHGSLYSHERPRLVEFLDEIPRHPGSMKVQRFKLHPINQV